MVPFFLIGSSVYFGDLVTKIFIRKGLPLGGEINIVPFFSIVHVQNTGMAFGLFQERNIALLLLGFVMTGVILWFGLGLLKSDRFSAYVLAMVLGGALGNLTDRLLLGWVTDFLDFYIGPYHWPAFNVADSAICVGAFMLIWHSLKASPRRRPGSR